MATKTLSLPIVLPSETSACERCVAELRGRLAHVRGVESVEVDSAANTLTVRMDPDRTSLAKLQDAAQRAGVAIARQFSHEMVELSGLDCADCAIVIEHALGRLPGILEVSVNYAAERMWIEYDRERTSRQDVIRRLEALGYRVRAEAVAGHHRVELQVALAAGALTLAGWLAGVLGQPSWFAAVIFGLAAVAGGWFPVRGTLKAFRARRADIDVLMVIAAVGAITLERWAEAAVLLFLFSLGHALEHHAMDRARQAIRAIVQLAPREAIVRRNGGEATVPVDEVRAGEVIVVRPGERIPLDGDICSGRSSVDQAPITGESMPVLKEPGSRVFAGTVNQDGALDIRVTRISRETTLARIIQLVQDAQAQKSPTQRVTAQLARYMVPGVLAMAALVIVIGPIIGMPFREAFYRAMTLLVAASPCALAVSTPAAVLSAIGRAAMGGILVKGGTALEDAGTVQVIALDKTGTLTLGQPAVTDILPQGTSEDAVLRIAAAVERRSEHPLARAIVAAAGARHTVLPEAHDVRAIVGMGVTGTVEGAQVAIGTLELLGHLQWAVTDEVRQSIARLQDAGKTAVAVAQQDRVIGIIALADVPRPSARQALEGLKQVGIRRLVMLTGDNARVGHAIASRLGVDEVRAGLLPEEKVDAVKALMTRDGKLAMVGDGVNDAPALAAATVGIAMGAGGTDAALETADMALMTDDLSRLPFAIGLSRATRRVIRQNLALSLGVVVLLVVTTLAGVMTLPPAVVLHEGSTLLVVANGLRLLAYRPPGANIIPT